jgi:tripartite-type tricarboxylate transporter receptor subunit TctC
MTCCAGAFCVAFVAALVAKAKPGALNYASGGNASQTRLAAELFRVTAAIDVKHIPYKGTSPGFTALMSGEAQFMFVSMPAAMPHVQSGRVRGGDPAGTGPVDRITEQIGPRH